VKGAQSLGMGGEKPKKKRTDIVVPMRAGGHRLEGHKRKVGGDGKNKSKVKEKKEGGKQKNMWTNATRGSEAKCGGKKNRKGREERFREMVKVSREKENSPVTGRKGVGRKLSTGRGRDNKAKRMVT